MSEEYHPELVGYVPTTDRPLRRPGRVLALRIMVLLGIAALVLPGVLFTVGVAATTAAQTCAVYVRHYAPAAAGSSAPFQLFSPGGVQWAGWQCYATDSQGDRTFITPLGLIPSAPRSFR